MLLSSTAFNGCDSLVNFHTTLIVCTGTATTTGNVTMIPMTMTPTIQASDAMLPEFRYGNDNGTPADTTHTGDIQLTDINGQFIFTGLHLLDPQPLQGSIIMYSLRASMSLSAVPISMDLSPQVLME